MPRPSVFAVRKVPTSASTGGNTLVRITTDEGRRLGQLLPFTSRACFHTVGKATGPTSVRPGKVRSPVVLGTISREGGHAVAKGRTELPLAQVAPMAMARARAEAVLASSPTDALLGTCPVHAPGTLRRAASVRLAKATGTVPAAVQDVDVAVRRVVSATAVVVLPDVTCRSEAGAAVVTAVALPGATEGKVGKAAARASTPAAATSRSATRPADVALAVGNTEAPSLGPSPCTFAAVLAVVGRTGPAVSDARCQALVSVVAFGLAGTAIGSPNAPIALALAPLGGGIGVRGLVWEAPKGTAATPAVTGRRSSTEERSFVSPVRDPDTTVLKTMS